MMKEKVLVVANAALSLSDSNGRTMAMLLSKYKPEQLAQFYTYGIPDKSICHNYYHVSDNDALKSFIRQRKMGGEVKFEKMNTTTYSASSKKRKRTPLTMLLREFVWKRGKWCGNQLFEWIELFEPTIIFVNLADNIFLIDFAITVSRKYEIPIVVFSTEEYAFKKYNYLTKQPSLLYWVFYRKLNNAYEKLSNYVECGYFNSPMLCSEYEKRYQYQCHIAMGNTKIEWKDNCDILGKIKVSYLGNLGLNRHLALIEVANAVAEVCPGVKLDVYGKIPNDEVKNALDNCININYNGFIKYEEVIEIIHESTLVIHAETQEPFYIRDLKYGFSTKIVDSVCSGTPLLIYGDKSMAAMDFLKKENCAFLCSDRDKLVDIVKKALTDIDARKKVLENAMRVKEKYFTGGKLNLMQSLENKK